MGGWTACICVLGSVTAGCSLRVCPSCCLVLDPPLAAANCTRLSSLFDTWPGCLTHTHAHTSNPDREHTISLPEWSDLPAGLQAVLIKAWADRRRDQEDSSAQGQLASAAAAGAGAQPLAVVGPSLTPSSAVVQPLVAASTGGAGVVAQPPPLPAAGQQASGGLMLVGQEQRAAAAAATPAGVSLQCVRALQQAAKSLSDAVSTQLHTPGS